MNTKLVMCARCKKNKNKEHFWENTKKINNLSSWCKDCFREVRKTEKYINREKDYRKSEERKKSIIKYNRSQKNKNNQKRYFSIKKNKERKVLWRKNQRRNNPKCKIRDNFSKAICRSIKSGKNGYSWESLVGYTLEDLMKHLEKQFDNKMSWENYGYYWHIDHIKPVALFNFNSIKDMEFIKCWELNNLQPLEAIANLKKGKKYDDGNKASVNKPLTNKDIEF